jgi:hypothetical protein
VLKPRTIAETRAAQERFWTLWRRGAFDAEPLVAWKARYLVADRLDGPPPSGAWSGARLRLRPLLENREYTLFEVAPGDAR